MREIVDRVEEWYVKYFKYSEHDSKLCDKETEGIEQEFWEYFGRFYGWG
jgi:hypothetical protein